MPPVLVFFKQTRAVYSTKQQCVDHWIQISIHGPIYDETYIKQPRLINHCIDSFNLMCFAIWLSMNISMRGLLGKSSSIYASCWQTILFIFTLFVQHINRLWIYTWWYSGFNRRRPLPWRIITKLNGVYPNNIYKTADQIEHDIVKRMMYSGLKIFTVFLFLFWWNNTRYRIINGLSWINVLVTSGAICQWSSRVTQSGMKIIGELLHEWPSIVIREKPYLILFLVRYFMSWTNKSTENSRRWLSFKLTLWCHHSWRYANARHW